MQKLTPENLPQVVKDHIAAYASHDLDAFLATLAPDALVNDMQREFLGPAAIAGFVQKEIFGDNVTLAIEAAFEHGANIVVRFAVDGDFDKTNLPLPLILTFYFTLEDGRIRQLIILHNKAVVQ